MKTKKYMLVLWYQDGPTVQQNNGHRMNAGSFENASFIVHAVNAHEELLLLAKSYRGELNEQWIKKGGDRSALDYCEQVIAKAEGR